MSGGRVPRASVGVPVVSDRWEGLDAFFRPGEEILLGDTADDVLAHLSALDDGRRAAMGAAARRRVLEAHTATHRAMALEEMAAELRPIGRNP